MTNSGRMKQNSGFGNAINSKLDIKDRFVQSLALVVDLLLQLQLGLGLMVK